MPMRAESGVSRAPNSRLFQGRRQHRAHEHDGPVDGEDTLVGPYELQPAAAGARRMAKLQRPARRLTVETTRAVSRTCTDRGRRGVVPRLE